MRQTLGRYELCKVIAQSCLLINGGAATAVIALMGKDKVDQTILNFVPWGLFAYSVGVLASVYMLYCVMMIADMSNTSWYHIAYDRDATAAAEAETEAHWWQARMTVMLGIAGGLFAVGCILVALGMGKSLPTSSLVHLLPK